MILRTDPNKRAISDWIDNCYGSLPLEFFDDLTSGSSLHPTKVARFKAIYMDEHDETWEETVGKYIAWLDTVIRRAAE